MLPPALGAPVEHLTGFPFRLASDWDQPVGKLREKEGEERSREGPREVPVRSLALAVSSHGPLLLSSVPPDSSGRPVLRLEVCPLGRG